MAGTARRRIRILCRRRGDVGGKAPTLQENVKMKVERREKILWCVPRGVESEIDIFVGETLEVWFQRFKK